MAAHLRYDNKSGKIEAKTPFGRFTEHLLQLNDEGAVRYRVMTSNIVSTFEAQLTQIDKELTQLETFLRIGKVTQDEYQECRAQLNTERLQVVDVINAQTGKQPLPNLASRYPAV